MAGPGDKQRRHATLIMTGISMDDWKENIGYLCHWCAMGMAAVFIFFVGWLTLRTMVSAPAELSARLIVPDFLTRPVHGEDYINLRCWVESDAPFFRSVVWNVGDGLREAESSESHMYLCMASTPSRNQLPVRVAGNPYSSVGFQQAESMLRIAPEGSGLYLVDARMVRSCMGNAAAFEGCKSALAEVRRHGAVLLFVLGDERELADMRRELSPYGFDDAMACRVDEWGDGMQSIRRAGGEYEHWSKPIVAVTDDEAIALFARDQGWGLRYICASHASPKLEPYTSASLTNFKDSLARQSITK
jgi:hypothetical protein